MLFLLLALSALMALIGAQKPFAPSDLINLDRVGAPSVSSDGFYAAFTRWTFNINANQATQAIWITDLRPASPNATDSRQVSTPAAGTSDSSPFWIDNRTLGFLSASRPSSKLTQVFTLNIERPQDAPVQLTDLPVPVETCRVFSRGSSKMLLLSARVYPSSSMAETREMDDQRAKDPSSAMTFDRLYVRHWDTFNDHKASHLFVAPLTLDDKSGSYSLQAEPLDLMLGTELESPVLPFGGPSDFSVSPDGQEIAFTSHKPGLDMAWSTDTNIYLVPTSGASKPVSISDDNLGYDNSPVYSPDGKKISYLSMKTPQYEADKRRVMLFDRASKQIKVLVDTWDRSPSSLAWSLDSASLFMTVPDDAKENVYQLDVATEMYQTILTGGFFSSLTVVYGGLVMLKSTQMAPNEVYSMVNGAAVKRTFVNDDKLQNILRSTPEEFWFTGAMDDNVHGWILKPVGYTAGKKYPVAFLVHGGPQSAWMDNFSTRWNPQVFAGAGFVVVAIDFHGSTSYGQEFTDAINGEWGSRPFEDLMLGLDYVIDHFDYVDGSRVAALGASYGGFMMNWFNGNTDRFSCLVNHCGLSDTRSMYFVTEEVFFMEHDFRGTPWESDLYEKWNPINLVDNWKTPTLVIHGGKDYRVVDGQGFATFTALQRQGVASRLVYFPDENHWILKPANTLKWHEEVLGWILKYTS